MFDVLLEGVEAFPSLDIYKEVGANTALTKIANVNVKDGFLTIEFRAIIENVSCVDTTVVQIICFGLRVTKEWVMSVDKKNKSHHCWVFLFRVVHASCN